MAYTATDREQIEEIKKWWNTYGKSIAVAVIIGLIIGFGWRYWQRYEKAEEMSASTMYQTVLLSSATGKPEATFSYVAKLQKDFGSSVYATLASFSAAKVAVQNKKYDIANTQLSWVMQKGKTPAYKQIARLRDARVLLQMKEPALAEKVIATVDDKDYQPMIDTVQGEVLLAQGKKKQAQEMFAKAETSYKAAGMTNPFLKLRLNS